jgi:hypothetical protein
MIIFDGPQGEGHEDYDALVLAFAAAPVAPYAGRCSIAAMLVQ